MSDHIIRILIADDSPLITRILSDVFESQSDMVVVGIAENGSQAVQLTKKLKPDLITMDIQMPLMNGFQATQEIMAAIPTPIIIITSKSDTESHTLSYEALSIGAVALLEKPKDVLKQGYEERQKELLHSVRLFSDLRVIRRPLPDPSSSTPLSVSPVLACKLLALAASTGGPQVYRYIFSHLKNVGVPIVAVQHIVDGFLEGFVEWLNQYSVLPVKIACDKVELQADTIYFAPDGFHTEVVCMQDKLVTILCSGEAIDYAKPSATRLFDSIARALPAKSMGGILTGMGSDGASGLLAMHQQRCYTFAQDEQSAIVYGMPSSALKLQGVDEIIRLDEIPIKLMDILKGDDSVKKNISS